MPCLLFLAPDTHWLQMGQGFWRPQLCWPWQEEAPKRLLPHIRDKEEGERRPTKKHLQVTAHPEVPRCGCGPHALLTAPMASTDKLLGESQGSSQRTEPHRDQTFPTVGLYFRVTGGGERKCLHGTQGTVTTDLLLLSKSPHLHLWGHHHLPFTGSVCETSAIHKAFHTQANTLSH